MFKYNSTLICVHVQYMYFHYVYSVCTAVHLYKFTLCTCMYCTCACAHLCYPSLSLPFLSVEERLKPIPKLVFSQHVKDMHKDRDRVFELEYQVMIISVYCYSYLWLLSLQSLTNPTIIPHEAAEHPVNRAKNRFANIKPCEK